MSKSVGLALFVTLFAMAAAFGQVVIVSTNPAAVAPTPDRYMIGGAITFTFAEEFSSSNGSIIVVTLDRPDLKFDTSRPPRAYKNGYPHNAVQVVTTPAFVALLMDPKTYDWPFQTITIENFSVDVMGAATDPGAIINGQAWTNDSRLSFINPTYRLFTVAAPQGRR